MVTYLQSKRIVAYNGADQRSRPYDMLRTQVLQSMDVGGLENFGGDIADAWLRKNRNGYSIWH